MSHNKLYRNFIILQGDEKTNSASGEKALSGYAKIEAKSDKCKISFYAQNLKKDEKYSVVLICYKKDVKQVVEIAPLDVTEVGKGEVTKEYYINNIAGLEFSYEKISGAGICKYVGGELTYIMYGFMNGENVSDGWKKTKVVKNNPSNEKYIEIKVEKQKEESSSKSKKTSCSNPKDKISSNLSGMSANSKRDKLESESRFDEYEGQIEGEDKVDPYNFRVRGSIGEYFENIVKDFTEIKDKYKEVKYCKWYNVKVDSLDDMCVVSNYNKYTIAYYPMLNYFPYIKKYGNFVLGYKCDDKGLLKYIVYGVPGKKDPDDQPYAGKTGFVTWIEGAAGEDGLWLMFYDYKTSTVVVPMK